MAALTIGPSKVVAIVGAVLAGLLAGPAGTLLAQVGAASWTFDQDAPDGPPTGFTLSAMRQDTPGTWRVRHESAGRGALVHTAGTPQPGYAMALAPHDPLSDVIVSVRLRLSAGGRAGGVVWRYQDPNNYYAAVLDLARSTLFMYLIRNGNRITVEAEDDLELDPDAWHTLRIVHERSSVYAALGGIRVFEERGGRLDRTLGAGRIGVLAAGDSDVAFDDLRVEPGRARR
jgi:hypothetical protein